MILYLDTSSLVKLYVLEPGSADVQRLVQQAELVSTSIVAYAEARAALARRRREKSLTPAEHRRARAAFEDDWPVSWHSKWPSPWPGEPVIWRSVTGFAGSMRCISLPT